MTPKLRAAIDAIRAAVQEDPTALATMATEALSKEELEAVGRAMLDKLADRVYSVCRRAGQIDALTEVAQKAVNIAKGYQALGEGALSEAFAKFAIRITRMAEDNLEVTRLDSDSIKADMPKPKPDPDGKLN